MLLRKDNIGGPKLSSTTEHQNIVPAASDTANELNLQILMGYGGESELHDMFTTLMQTGRFDNAVCEYAKDLNDGLRPAQTVSVTLAGDSNEVKEMLVREKKERANAETAPTAKETANNPDIGIQRSENTSLKELNQAAAFQF